MKIILCLAVILAGAVNVILADGEEKLQNLGWIIEKMNIIQLRQYSFTPVVWNNGTHQFIRLNTTSSDPTSTVCDTATGYLANAVGPATSSCYFNGIEIILEYIGLYDGTLRVPNDIGLLAIVIRSFGDPTLGNEICHLVDSFTTPSGFAYICLSFLASLDNYQALANKVYSYLYSTKLLSGNSTSNTVFCNSDGTALLEIWGTDCTTSAQVIPPATN